MDAWLIGPFALALEPCHRQQRRAKQTRGPAQSSVRRTCARDGRAAVDPWRISAPVIERTIARLQASPQNLHEARSTRRDPRHTAWLRTGRRWRSKNRTPRAKKRAGRGEAGKLFAKGPKDF